MTSQVRMVILVSLLLTLLMLFVFWSYGQWASALSRMQRAAEVNQTIAKLAGSIESLHRQPTLGVQELGDSQFKGMLQQAAKTAGLSSEGLIHSIRPQASRRMENTRYRRIDIELRLQDITLQQLTMLLHALVRENPGLHVEALQLHKTAVQGDVPAWTVDPLVISYLLYIPQ